VFNNHILRGGFRRTALQTVNMAAKVYVFYNASDFFEDSTRKPEFAVCPVEALR